MNEAERLETETAESADSKGPEQKLPFCASATRSCLPVLTYQLGLTSQLGVLQPQEEIPGEPTEKTPVFLKRRARKMEE